MNIPSSKSITHRAYILASKAVGSRVINPLVSEDTDATLNCLVKLGMKYTRIEDGIEIIEPISHGSRNLGCANSGTTLRLLTGVAACLEGESILIGDDSLNRRPMNELVEALQILGATISAVDGHAPITISSPVTGTSTRIGGSTSSQFITSLLFNAAFRNLHTRIEVQLPIVSSPYITLTLEMLEDAGIPISMNETPRSREYLVDGKKIGPQVFNVPADFSSAAFFIAAGCMGENEISFDNLSNTYTQADSAIIKHLRSMGGDVSDKKAGGSKLHAQNISLKDSPDLFPILSVVMALAAGRGILSGAHHLRYKESDRIATTVEMLKAMGAGIRTTEDGAVINTKRLLGDTTINPYNDHRIAMAAAIAATQAEEPTTILNPQCVSVSYPRFFDDLEKLGGRIRYHN